ncbi:MAG: S8 family serine peptidase [Nitriliruptor sp.]|uniref:S8 family serine peptidase n=1 Tax=Nitriliruptor sp. TaxID=2448056 RepID=UPI0034A04BAB
MPSPTSQASAPIVDRRRRRRSARAVRGSALGLALGLTLGLVVPSTAAATGSTSANGGGIISDEVAPTRSNGAGSDVTGLIVELGPSHRAERARTRLDALTPGRANLGAHLGGGARTLELGRPMSHAEAERVAGRLVADGLVVEAVPDAHVTIAAAPNDPFYSEQWALSGRYGGKKAYGAGVEAAWDTTIGSSDVVVAVLDTGVLPHPDITGRLVPGYDFVDGDADATDPGDWCEETDTASSWHGTHVAGTVGATTGNSAGVAGVDQRARIQPVRVLGSCGGALSSVIAGIRWSAGLPVSGLPTNPTPADVINISLSSAGSCQTSTQNAIDAATAAGSLVVVAAGNEGTDAAASSPANCANVIAVAATSHVGDRAFYSNYGSVVDLAAPGGDSRYGSAILSLSNRGTTTPDTMGYRFEQGTSMAAPHVAGTAALALSVDPSLTPAKLTTLLRSTATAFPTSSPSGSTWVCSSVPTATYHCGAGIVDAAAAVISASAALAAPKPAPAPQTEPEPEPVAATWPSTASLSFDLAGEDFIFAWPAAIGAVDRYEVLRDGVVIASTPARGVVIEAPRLTQRTWFEVRAVAGTAVSLPLGRFLSPAPSFSDVAADSWFRTDIAWLATAGITGGCGGDRFCPTASVTRQQMAAFLVRGLGLTATSGVRFSDVPADSVFATDIDKLATAGITSGCGDDRFCPTAPVTRQQMARFLTHGLGLTATSGVRFSDVPADSVFATDIDELATAGITSGCGDDRFCPTASVTRQQMAAFLRRGLVD